MQGAFVFAGRTFRVVPPRWAHAALSSEGARLHGGRFNPAGTPAFYSALDPHTAYAEYTQGLFDRPGLLCSFDVAKARVIDLTMPEGLSLAGLTGTDLVARWIGQSESATQVAALRLIEAGLDGLIYRSTRHGGGRNFVLWRIEPPVQVVLIDRMGESPVRPLE